MLSVGADVQVAEFPVVLVGVHAVGQEDEDDFVFGVGPGEGAREAGVPERLLGGQDVAGATSTGCGPIKASGAAVAGILLFGEFGVSSCRKELLPCHFSFIEKELHDVC